MFYLPTYLNPTQQLVWYVVSPGCAAALIASGTSFDLTWLRGSSYCQWNLVDLAHDVLVRLVNTDEHLGLGRQLALNVRCTEDAL